MTWAALAVGGDAVVTAYHAEGTSSAARAAARAVGVGKPDGAAELDTDGSARPASGAAPSAA